ncbi:PREDICTED: uncharacterized protein LOC105995216 [Dipodomys ordii]|uniref:Uncharacterized protein LOC105995216 n=1 Tax=Dipodomys ordii TaxID=10020 RepID=A0A1S3G6B1_DIPOR|nr:PREDICTED: uncharacterized protein LOC105995216 [Dipodomys ordii]
MERLLRLYYVFFFLPYCFVVPKDSKLGEGSLILGAASLDSLSEIPWMASISGSCQGIVLSRWWILSTANCVKKKKMSHLDISGINDPENIQHGQRICIHPKFDPEGGKDPVKADIGLILLDEALESDTISLSQSPNVSLKSCARCQYDNCQVYQFKSSKDFVSARVKKVPIHLLDLSVCHHEQSDLKKNEGFCIQGQLLQDCWVQQASPILCFLKNHLELVGLVHRASNICHYPAIIVRTAPYFTWLKRFIKASKKQTNSPPSNIRCRVESDHIPPILHGPEYTPTMVSHKHSIDSLDISVPTKPLKDSSGMFTLKEVQTSTESHKHTLGRSQVSKVGKFLVEPMRTASIARFSESDRNNSVQYHRTTPSHDKDFSRDSVIASTAKSSLPQLISDTSSAYDSNKPDTGKASSSSEETWNRVMAEIIKQWSPPLEEETQSTNAHSTTKAGSGVQSSGTTGKYDSTSKYGTETTANMEGYMDSLMSYTGNSWSKTKPSQVPSEVPLEFLTSDETMKKSKSWHTIFKGDNADSQVIGSTWIPPTGTVEPWKSSTQYHHTMRARTRNPTDSVRFQSPLTTQKENFHMLPIAKVYASKSPKIVTYGHTNDDFEDKHTGYHVQSTITPSQGRSPIGPRIHPITDFEPDFVE